jgi:hypothetical protein
MEESSSEEESDDENNETDNEETIVLTETTAEHHCKALLHLLCQVDNVPPEIFRNLYEIKQLLFDQIEKNWSFLLEF